MLPKATLMLNRWPLPKKGVMKDVSAHLVTEDYWVKTTNLVSEYGKVTKTLGFKRLGTFTLEGPVQLIDQLPLATGATKPLFACATEIYQYNDATESISPITRYDEGTITVTNGSSTVSGIGTNFDKHVKAGDTLIEVNGAARNYTVQTVVSATEIQLTTTYAEATETSVPYKIRQVFDNTGVWSGDVYSDKYYLTNGVDKMVRWNGTDTYLELVGGDPPIARYVKTYLTYLILGFLKIGATVYPYSVAWCDAGDPDNWTSGDAQQRTLPQGDDWILGMEELRGRLIIYRERSQDFLEYIGGPYVFHSGNLSSGLGPISHGSIVNMIEDHVFITPAGVYSFDGDTPKMEGTGVIQQWLLKQIHPGYLDAVVSLIVEEKNLIYFFYPSTEVTGSWCDKFLLYNFVEDTFFEGEAPNITAAGFYEKYADKYIDDYTEIIDTMTDLIDSAALLALSPINLVGDKDGKIFVIEGLNIEDTTKTQIDAFGETGVDVFGDASKVKVLTKVYFDASASELTTIDFYVGRKFTPFEGFYWFGPFSVPVGGSKEYVSLPRIAGKYFARRIQVVGLDTSFELRDMLVEYHFEGER